MMPQASPPPYLLSWQALEVSFGGCCKCSGGFVSIPSTLPYFYSSHPIRSHSQILFLSSSAVESDIGSIRTVDCENCEREKQIALALVFGPSLKERFEQGNSEQIPSSTNPQL